MSRWNLYNVQVGRAHVTAAKRMETAAAARTKSRRRGESGIGISRGGVGPGQRVAGGRGLAAEQVLDQRGLGHDLTLAELPPFSLYLQH